MSDELISPTPSNAREPAEPGADLAQLRDKTGASKVLTTGLKIFGEIAFTPGTSLLIDGKVKAGFAHAGVGFIARRMLGLPGILLVGANSYSQSVTGKSLLQHAQALAGPSEESLERRVKKAIDENKSLGEILALVAEDVEDKYHSHANKA